LRIIAGGLENLNDLVLSVLSVGDVVLDMGMGGFVARDMGAVGGIEDSRLESEESFEGEHV
jgi:hypothetical protein